MKHMAMNSRSNPQGGLCQGRGCVVHKNDFAVGKTIDYHLYRRPHENVLRHCAERSHISFLTNYEVATSKRFMCTSPY